jgi:hypothetical protein
MKVDELRNSLNHQAWVDLGTAYTPALYSPEKK